MRRPIGAAAAGSLVTLALAPGAGAVLPKAGAKYRGTTSES
jgi:hypothetical protein